MKSPKGFRGRYFSLAAILAFSTTVTLANQTQSVVATKKEIQKQEELDDKEELTPSAEELDVVVVSKKIKTKQSKVYSASKNYVSKTNITDNVNILTSEEMELQGMTTVIEALNNLPGVSFTSAGGYGKQTNLYLQGMNNKYTLVMIDGVRYNDPSNFDGVRLEYLMLNDIERIEVIKGAQSGVWGADAVAGVVNIITKKAKEPGTNASVNLEMGSYKTRTANVSLSHRTKEYDILVSTLRKTSDGFTAAADKNDDLEQYEDDGYRNTTVNLKAGYWINSDNRIEAGYHDTNSFVYFDSGSGAGNANTEQKADYKAKSGYLKYKYYTGRHLIETTFNQSYFDTYNYGYTTNYEGKNTSLELKDTYKYGKDNSLLFGVSYENRDVNYDDTWSLINRDDNNKAVFINNSYRTNNLIFTQAFRYDYFSAFDDKLTGKLGIKYLFTNDINIYTNTGTGYLAPSVLQMINPWGADNLNLKPEETKSMSVGLNYYDLNLNIFRNEVKDMIQWQGAGFENVEGTSTFEGFEASYQKAVMNNLLLGFNYSYVSAKDKDGDRLEKVPKYQVGINSTYGISSKLKLNVNGSYIGSRIEGTNETGKYFVANSKIDYNINETFSTYLKVDNILDKEYQTHYGYATPRRSYYLGFNAKF